MNEQPTNPSPDQPQNEPIDSHTPYQEGVLHGPHKPTENPYEQTDQHRVNLGEAAYTIGNAAEQKLTEGLDAQRQATTDAIYNREYDKLGSLAGPAVAEDHAEIYEAEDLAKAEDSELV